MKVVTPLLSLMLFSCAPHPMKSNTEVAMDTAAFSKGHRTIAQILADSTPRWMKLEGVIGTGESRKDGKPAVVIFVDHSANLARLPGEIDGYAITIERTGSVRAD